MSRLDVTTDCTDCEARIRAEVIEEFKDLGKLYSEIRADCLEEFVKNVLYELNGIAEDESYYFDKDNANLVSSVMYGQLEQLKEQK